LGHQEPLHDIDYAYLAPITNSADSQMRGKQMKTSKPQ